MDFDPSPAIGRAQEVVNGLLAALPSALVGLVVFALFYLLTIAAKFGVLSEPAPDVLLLDFAPAGVSLRVRWWIAPPRKADALDGRDQVLTAIRLALAREGIDLPFPTHQVLFHDQTEPTYGDRVRQREGWPPGPAA